MNRSMAALLLAALPAFPAGGLTADTAYDASIVTAIDMSESIRPDDIRAELAALAAALRSPEFLAASSRGAHGRIRFAMFAWHNGPIDFLPWTAIGSRAEAEAAARLIEARVSVDVDLEARGRTRWYAGRLTDLSRALDHAGALAGIGGAPLIVNVVGSGADNVGEPAATARDRLLAGGATVNGVIVGGTRDDADYYRREVAGGTGSFVVVADRPDALGEIMRRKLVLDLVASVDVPLGQCTLARSEGIASAVLYPLGR